LSSRSGLLDIIVGNTWSIQKELDLYGVENTVLNDLASIVYGIPRLVNEIRILIPRDTDNKVVVNTLVEVLSMHRYRDSILEALEEKGSVALNPVTMPIVYVIKSTNNISNACLEKTLTIDIYGYMIRVPRLEEYIAYLYSLEGLYPYIVDAITLHIIHYDRIDYELLRNYNIDIELICNIVKELEKLVNTFYELEELVRVIKEKYCKSL